MKLMFKIFGVPAFVLSSMLSGAAAQAGVVYTYTGNPFTVFGGGATCPSDCVLTGSFTVAQALPANLSYNPAVANVTPDAFSFTDGGANTFTESSGLFEAFFSIGTNGSGDIDRWVIGLISGDQSAQLDSDSPDPNGFTFDQTGFQFTAYALNQNAAGTWSESTIPEPATGAMLLAGFALLGLNLKRRRADIPQ